MEDYVGYRDLNSLHQRNPNLIDGYISNYCFIINYPEGIDLIKQANYLVSVLGDIESNRLGEKEDRKKIFMEADYQRKNTSVQKQTREDE